MKREDNFVDILKETFIRYWEKPALTDYITKLSYTNKGICEKIAKNHIIFEKCNITPSDKIAILGRNSAHWAIAYLSIITNGSVVVPVLDDFNPIDIEHILNHSETTLLICDSSLLKNINIDNLTSVKYIMSLENFEFLHCSKDATLNIDEVSNTVELLQSEFDKKYPNGFSQNDINYYVKDKNEMMSLNYTSGTTSMTKGVMLSGLSITSNITYIPFQFASRNLIMNKTICVLPMAHAYGLAFAFLGPMIYGIEIYFLGKVPSPNILLDACQEIKPELLLLVPLVFEKIYKYNVAPLFKKPIVKFLHEIKLTDKILHKVIVGKIKKLLGGNLLEVIIGGAAFNSHIEKFLNKGGFPFTVGYGMTECGPLMTYIENGKFAQNSVGRVLEGDFLKIRIKKSNPNDKSGEIQVIGDNVMLGYYKEEEATSINFTEDGWLKSGDLGYIDNKGNVFINGRSKTMLLGASGENIYPEAIETKLSSLPLVAECIIIQNEKGRLEAYVYPDYPRMKSLKISKDKVPARMEENRLKLNRITAKYENISALYILEHPLPKTPKNTIKRYGLDKYLSAAKNNKV